MSVKHLLLWGLLLGGVLKSNHYKQILSTCTHNFLIYVAHTHKQIKNSNNNIIPTDPWLLLRLLLQKKLQL